MGNLYKVSGVDFLPDGTAVVSEEGTGTVNWVDPATMEIQRSVTIPNAKGTSGDRRVLVAQDNGDVLATTVYVGSATYNEYAELNLLRDPSKVDAEENLPDLPTDEPADDPADEPTDKPSEKPADKPVSGSSGNSAPGSSLSGIQSFFDALFRSLGALFNSFVGMFSSWGLSS
ncbi:hypothetical protein [Corynebacterium evansiae]|uniref:PT domain-containing protein n=2 Tax=Actinomycetes TaxID=1760 RepID=A0A9X3LLU3_9CORY|nr:hypothetical protein [Corynebacterium evansiae]MCZ9290381.1 PT domain-containing protein [Corynebacterium evansiae]